MIVFQPLYAYADRRAKSAAITFWESDYLASHLREIVLCAVREFVQSKYPGTIRRFVRNRVRDEIARLRKTCNTVIVEELPEGWQLVEVPK